LLADSSNPYLCIITKEVMDDIKKMTLNLSHVIVGALIFSPAGKGAGKRRFKN
jgi:hypothetical protein